MLKNVELRDVDEILYLYMKDHIKKFNQYLLKVQFKLFFNNKDCKNLMTDLINNTTNISWSSYLREAIIRFKKEGYHFNHIAEMHIVTLAHKRDMTYDFYLKHNMAAFKRKVNAVVNKDQSLIYKFPRNWKHPMNTKFGCYRNNVI